MPRVTTKREDREFSESIIPDTLLELSLDWISSHMKPEDVFDEKDLADWAIGQGYSKE